MAILSAIFSLLARELGTILQAIFGWSITALFGKLPSRAQTLLSAALLGSIIWPLLVVGCFVPGAAAWALAFLPLQHWFGKLAMRIVWIALAVLVPLAVGAVTRAITPPHRLRGGLARTLLGGYVLTIAYALAFLVTALTVPVVKVISTARRWADTHVYVQPKEGRYFDVLDALAAACKRAGVEVVREAVPAPMALATSIIRTMARPFLSPAEDSDPQRLRAADLEVYLYPADLLLRGAGDRVAHVRAAMTRTELAKCAYLVQSEPARELQDAIGAVPHPAPADVRALSRKLDRAQIPFEEWTALETLLRRLERRALGQEDLVESASDRQAAPRDEPRAAARRGRLAHT